MEWRSAWTPSCRGTGIVGDKSLVFSDGNLRKFIEQSTWCAFSIFWQHPAGIYREQDEEAHGG
jgi:hypothetical protein